MESAGPKPGYRPCVGIFLLNAERKVFVGQRHDAGGEAWQMPQGGIDVGEEPVQAGHREMAEEIGTSQATLLQTSRVWRSYDLPKDIARRIWGGRYLGQSQLWLAYSFTGEDADIRLDLPHPEFRAWRWADPGHLATLVVPFKREVYLSVADEFHHLWA